MRQLDGNKRKFEVEFGCRMQDPRSKMQDPGCRIQDARQKGAVSGKL